MFIHSKDYVTVSNTEQSTEILLAQKPLHQTNSQEQTCLLYWISHVSRKLDLKCREQLSHAKVNVSLTEM